MHLLRAGKTAGNCLIRKSRGGTQPNPDYWQAMLEGLTIFAITRRKTLCCLFTIQDGAYHEWEYVKTPKRLGPFIEACLKRQFIGWIVGKPYKQWKYNIPWVPDEAQAS